MTSAKLALVQTDAQLLEAWRAGDKQAGELLFDRYFDALVLFFRTKVSRGVDDLVQQTLLACLEGQSRHRGEAPFRGYLFGIARNVLGTHYRRISGPGALDLGSITLHDLGERPSEILARGATHRLLLEGLRRLPVRDQIVLELYFWEQLTAAEIATAMDAPEPTIRTWIRRARIRLGEEIERLATGARLENTNTNLDAWVDEVRSEFLAGRRQPESL